ncbi:hypothetical protein ABZS81_31365 [Streptomyces sp. NPDC005318]
MGQETELRAAQPLEGERIAKSQQFLVTFTGPASAPRSATPQAEPSPWAP